MSQFDSLIIALKERVREQAAAPDKGYYYRGPVRPPLAPEQIQEAERLLGFRLPLLMQRFYSEVGDGFWGPGFGLLPLLPCISDAGVGFIVESRVKYPEIDWPSNLIYLCGWGCGFDAYIDYIDPGLPVIFEDCDGPDDNYIRWPSGYSLDEFFQAWLDKGVDTLNS